MRNRKGFTLLETSIVLVIIALIFSLVTYAAGLIKQTQTKSLITELSQYQQIIEAFRTRYLALPGDFANAYYAFGDACASSASDCNGNSNGIIEGNSTVNDVEALRAWQHLYLAGFLSTAYPGIATVSGQSDIGVNIPPSAWPGAGIELNASATTQNGINGNAIQVAGFASSSAAKSANIMTPLDAWNIDSKIDDGIGKKGKILGFNSGAGTTCVGSDNLTYNLNLTTKVCYIKYLLYPNFNS
ncbi:type II secretion system protein [Holosporaceae bacterium 'Namur']|nr:type II secretion system protein [Holosporaceae bacterium 'Namur']